MSKTLVVTEKKSVADDFARVLKGFKKRDLAYERDELVIAWASGHLLELKNPDAYDPKYKRWLLADLPILPENFEHEPRSGDKRSETLLKHLVKELNRPDVSRVVNACDAGREGELIFSLILEHAKAKKPVLRMWLQSLTSRAIEAAFEELASAGTRELRDAKADAGRSHQTLYPERSFKNLRDAAYSRDEADWLIGMNGTRALTRKFMGRSRNFLAVGRVKTPTLAFLVDREREIDAFVAVPYFQIDATFDTAGAEYSGRWSGTDRDGRKTDRLPTLAEAEAIRQKVAGKPGVGEDHETKRREAPPLLFDLTTLQREASSRFGYTLDRTLRCAQSLYEASKAITYPRTSSRFLPDDYGPEIPQILGALRHGPLGHVAAQVPTNAMPEVRGRVFNTAKVSDHFALIPTGENPQNLRDDERHIYEMIVRRFLAVFLPSADWLNVTRTTVVEGETFETKGRRLAVAGWRAVEPATEDLPLPALAPGGKVATKEVEVLSKETQPPSRYTDGSLVKAMEASGKDVEHGDELDEVTIEEIKEKGIGTPATRAAIVKDLIDKRLARREGRSILPSPLGCSLVRLVRNLSLDALAKADTTGEWEYRLALMTRGDYTRDQFSAEMKRYVEEIVNAVRSHDGGNDEIFERDHGAGGAIKCPRCSAPLAEKTFSFMCGKCELNISKDQSGKYVFPETLRRLLKDKRIGPMTGFERTRASGFLKLNDAFDVEVELAPSTEADAADAADTGEDKRYETVPEGAVMGKCPKCKARGVDSDVVRSGMGYKCVRNVARAKEKECDFRLAEKIRYRFLPPDQIRKLMAGEKTDYLFGFISRNGKRFQASLNYSPEGELQWEFPPRAPKKVKKKKDGEEGESAEAPAAEAAEKPAKPEKPAPKRRSTRKPTPKE
jgi:DNA topoisomerase III